MPLPKLRLCIMLGIFVALQSLAYASSPGQYSLNISTNSTHYVGLHPVVLSGIILPSPESANTVVNFSVISPQDTSVYTSYAAVSANGIFRATIVPGISSDWGNGTYIIDASYSGATANVTFDWVKSPLQQTSNATANYSFMVFGTGAPTYTGTETVKLSGALSGPPEINGSVVSISVISPDYSLVDFFSAVIKPTGAFNLSFTAGNNVQWTNGTYKVIAHYENAVANATFGWKQAISQQTKQGSNGTQVKIPVIGGTEPSIIGYAIIIVLMILVIAAAIFIRRRRMNRLIR
jgi:hypothetical protein